MATSIERKLEKHLECPICLEKFKEPKVLTCQHSYCKKCLERLVTRDRADYEITCPECRMKTKVPGGDVNRLQTNFLLNNLLSLNDDTQKPSKKSVNCPKHDEEMLKLFCQTCEQPICRDCTIFDHRGHRYLFIKDVFDAEKEKVLKLAEESRTAISALESAVVRVEAQELKLQENSQKVSQCIDSFINARIETLKAGGEHLKNELQKSISTQENDFHARKDSLFLSLGCLKSSVEFTEQALSRGDEVAVLTAKGQLFQQLKQSAGTLFSPEAKQHEAILYTLKFNAPLNNEAVSKMAYIRMHDEEYKLSTYGGSFGRLEETYVDKDCDFAVSIKKIDYNNIRFGRDPFKTNSDQTCRPVINNVPLMFPAQNCALVIVKTPRSGQLHSTVLRGEEGSFFFSYLPDEIGTYKIEIIINGRYVQGSPFDWIVKGFKSNRQYMKMDDEFD